ncbi:MAG TPA: SAM-dependent methyltransferase [Acidimicrobiales bacterium]|nr:SAM-dependent methyltransferase [Acidimicrobiales bacterium]
MRPDDRAAAARTTREFFEGLWTEGDHWDLETSELDQRRYARQLALLAGCRYRRALELGCGAGSFTRHLAPLCDLLMGIDVAPSAVSRAREALAHLPHVELKVGDIMELDAEAGGPWDLVVLAETAYYLGWLYPLFDVGWLAHALHQATTPGGRLLLVNTYGADNGLMSRWLIDTYRDLFANAGYRVETEETIGGVKDGVAFDILLSLMAKDGR